MTQPVATRAQEVAFADLREETLKGAPKVANTEFLHQYIAMMELERCKTRAVSTIDAAASCTGNEFGLATVTTTLLRSIRLGVSLAAPVFAELCDVQDRD